MANPYSKIIVLSAICALVAVAFGLLYTKGHTKAPSPSPQSLSVTRSPAPCSSPVQSFCPTQSLFIGYVSSGDFSDVLEHQTVTHVTCGSPGAPNAACVGVAKNFPIDVFAVQQNGTTTYLTRNNYIVYFQQYAASYGPFSFQSDVQKPGELIMTFKSSKSAKSIGLVFTQKQSTWQLAAPQLP